MQLDLFCDNRHTIRLNDADELLRALRLEESLAVYDELLADAPGDLELLTLQGVFGLSLKEQMADRASFVEALETAHRSGSLPAPRLWFGDLRYAEYLRAVARNDRELVRIRRRMRQLCGFMFERYMEKMRGTAGGV